MTVNEKFSLLKTYLKAEAKKNKIGLQRRKRQSAILTDSPVKEQLKKEKKRKEKI